MKKLNMLRVRTLIIFEFPLQPAFIGKLSSTTHEYYNRKSPGWSLTGTYRKIVLKYWYGYVPWHFAGILVLAVLGALLFTDASLNQFFLGGLLIAGSISFPVLLAAVYWPYFYGDFVPRLKTALTVYDTKPQEQLPAAKCRSHQMTNLALAIACQIFSETGKFPSFHHRCNQKTADALKKLMGMDSIEFLKKTRLLQGDPTKLSPNQLTWMEKAIGEVQQFFEELKFKEGIAALKKFTVKYWV